MGEIADLLQSRGQAITPEAVARIMQEQEQERMAQHQARVSNELAGGLPAGTPNVNPNQYGYPQDMTDALAAQAPAPQPGILDMIKNYFMQGTSAKELVNCDEWVQKNPGLPCPGASPTPPPTQGQ